MVPTVQVDKTGKIREFLLVSKSRGKQKLIESRRKMTESENPHKHSGCPWSWKVMEFRKTIFQAWKVMESSKGLGKSWKIMLMSWSFYYCTEQLCKSDTNSFIKSNCKPFLSF